MPYDRKRYRIVTLLLGAIMMFASVLPVQPVSASVGSAIASEPLNIVAAAASTTFVADDATWQYLDNGSNPGADWRDPSKTVSGWKTGQAVLGYGNGGEETVVSYGSNAKAKYPVTYFRGSFTVQGASSYSALKLNLDADDGAIVYLNGVEAFRTPNLAKGANLPYTDGYACADGVEQADLNPKLLREGANLIAVEVHQCTPSSSDLSFAARLVGESSGVVSPPTTVPPTNTPTTAPTNAPTTAPTTAPTQPPAGVDSVLVAADAAWEYLDNGSNPGADWRDPSKSISGWKSGPAILGYGNGDEKTVVSFGSNAKAKYPITYFRNSFNLTQAAGVSGVKLTLNADDGAIVYVNGVEAYRTPNLAKGANLPYTDGYACADGPVEADIDPKLLRDGANLIAVEVHQCTASSSDLTFAMELKAKVTAQPTAAPTATPTTAPTTAPTAEPTTAPTAAPVNGVLVADDAAWQYLDSGSAPADWFKPGVSLSGWKSGAAMLGFPAGDGIATTIANRPVVYFRHNFNIGDPAGVSALKARLSVDDGAIVYINGVEAFRTPNLAQGANLPYTDGYACTSATVEATLDPKLLKAGDNLIAVEAHNCTADSSDIEFAMRLEATGSSSTQPTAAPTTAPTTAPTAAPTSAPTAAPVNGMLIANEAAWQYLDSGSAPAGWMNPDTAVSGWKSGAAMLGYPAGGGITTTINNGAVAYFRNSFTVSDPAVFTALKARLSVDDGAIVYVNGVEAFRTPNLAKGSNLPYTDGYACSSATVEATLDPRLLKAGNNLVAVEAHNCTDGSSDLEFAMQLEGTGDGVVLPPGTAPTPNPTTQPTQPGGQPTPVPTVTQVPLPGNGKAWYAAPNGSSTGDGSSSRPWDLATALRKTSSIRPGDTLWLRGGKYGSGRSTTFRVDLAGTSSSPVIVRAYPGERAIVDGSLTVYGKYTWFWGFEITNSYTERHTSPSNRPGGMNIFAPGTKVINMAIYNVGHPGIGQWIECGDGAEIYGTLIYGVGLYDATTKEGNSNWTRGSAIYAQNQSGNRIISDNITFRNFTTGMKAYTEGSYANGFKFLYNVQFGNNDRNIFTSGRDNPARGVEMTGNMTYRTAGDDERSMTLGYANVDQYDAIIKNNYIVNGTSDLGALYVKRFKTLNVSGNTVVSRNNLVTFYRASSPSTQSWNNNDYYMGSGALFRYNDTSMNFSTWKSKSGFDSNSTYHSGLPTTNRIFVRQNKYEPKRANIVVYNWEGRSSVSVDLNGILANGDKYKIVDAQNFFGPAVASGTFDGSAISLPTNLTAVAPITGTLQHFTNKHTPSEFNTYVLLPAN